MHQHSVINSSLNQHSNTKYPCISAGFKALKYYWRELPQVPFLSWEMCFWQQKYFVMTNIILSQQMFCHDKHTFVATKDIFCHDKYVFVMTKLILCCDKSDTWGSSRQWYRYTTQSGSSSEENGDWWCQVNMHWLLRDASQSVTHTVPLLYFRHNHLQAESTTKSKMLPWSNLLSHLLQVVYNQPWLVVTPHPPTYTQKHPNRNNFLW